MTSREHSKNSDEQLKQPVSLNFNQKNVFSLASITHWFARYSFILMLLLTLLFVLYFVIVQLPDSVSEPTVELDAKSLIATETLKPIDESPWHEAQLAKHRREAQEILADVLAKQKSLENKKVLLWAEEAFNQAISNAQSGDLFYRSQEFSQAMESYQLTLKQLQEIEDNIPQIFKTHLKNGQQALTENDAITAKKHLQIALYLTPENEQAKLAFDRTLVLKQVLALIEQGMILIDEQQLESSRTILNQASTLDAHSPLVIEQLKRVNKAIKDRDYALAMSQGYKNLNNKHYQQAISDFTAAQKISPAASDPKRAIQQSKNEALKAAITRHIHKAQQSEQLESWQPALLSYKQALELDKTLISAKVGMLRSSARAELDQNLQLILKKPERLANENVYAKAKLVYANAIQIKNKGKKLQQQTIDVKYLLARIKLPVSLRIKSDNRTQITLYRVGELGHFLAKELTLKPGEYTIQGSRNGYRDVRQEFTLMPGHQLKTIVIQCSEKVSNG